MYAPIRIFTLYRINILLLVIAIIFGYKMRFYARYAYSEQKISEDGKVTLGELQQQDFAFINKSYIGDLYRSFQLYKSFLKHYKGDSKFIIVVPNSDIEEFKSYFAVHATEIEHRMPVLFTDEFISTKCHLTFLERYKLSGNRLHGWRQQQVIKLCLAFSDIAKQYVTFDSDNELIRDFDDKIFLDKSGMIKTVTTDHANFDLPAKAIYKALGGNNRLEPGRRFFVSMFALWNANFAKEMMEYMNQKHKLNTFGIIIREPWEIQWYGQYMKLFHNDKFFEFHDNEYALAVHKFGADGSVKDEETLCNVIIKQLLAHNYKDKYISILQSNLGYKEYSIREFFENRCKKLPNFDKIYDKYKKHCNEHQCKATIQLYWSEELMERDFWQYGLMLQVKDYIFSKNQTSE